MAETGPVHRRADRQSGPVHRSAQREGGWPALLIEAAAVDDELDGYVAALIVDFNPIAIEDLTELPLPPGGLWDPTFPPIPDPPPSPLRWRAFFNEARDRDAAHAALAAAFPALALAKIEVPDEDWAARSQQSLTAVEAGRFIVTPPWDLATAERLASGAADSRLVVIVEPSMGFGTGHHATTRLCLRALSAMTLAGRSVLDLGTGSGVLAIAAAMAGARTVIGIDIDRDAIDNARHNASLNRTFVPPTFEVADFRDPSIWAGLKTGPYTAGGHAADIVVANLTGGMLRATADTIISLVAPGGTLLVSGFDESERPAVRETLGDWEHETAATEDSWVALTLSASLRS